jgi:hypothetical protein
MWQQQAAADVIAMDMQQNSRLRTKILDTDSLYLAIACDPSKDNSQGFKHVIKNVLDDYNANPSFTRQLLLG